MDVLRILRLVLRIAFEVIGSASSYYYNFLSAVIGTPESTLHRLLTVREKIVSAPDRRSSLSVNPFLVQLLPKYIVFFVFGLFLDLLFKFIPGSTSRPAFTQRPQTRLTGNNVMGAER